MGEIPGLLLFSLIFMRMSGFILLNPIFGRRNIPGLVKAGFIMALSISLFSFSDSMAVNVEIRNSIDYGVLLLKEFSVGYILGYVMNLFFYTVAFAGGLIDFYMGMSMANVFDPQNNSNMPLTGSILNVAMIMLFFSVDGHIAVLKIFMDSAQVIPYTQITVTPQAIGMILELFKECTLLAVKMTFPFLALQFLAEVGVGVLMRVIPQINVFVVNIQVKVIIGDFLFLLLCAPMGEYLGDLIDWMINAVSRIVMLL